MMALLGIATIASLTVSAVLAVRLLRLAQRTRERPEFAIGLAFLVAGVIGYSLMLAVVPHALASIFNLRAARTLREDLAFGRS